MTLNSTVLPICIVRESIHLQLCYLFVPIQMLLRVGAEQKHQSSEYSLPKPDIPL